MSPTVIKQSSIEVASHRAPTLALEVNRLFSLYRPFIGDRQPMAGGAQGLLMKQSRQRCGNSLPLSSKKRSFRVELSFNTDPLAIRRIDKNPGSIGNRASTSFSDLPSEVKLYIFTFLPINDLCKTCLVDKEWSFLANDERLWRHLLDRDSNRWRQIYNDRNPDIFRQVCPAMNSKQIYLKCRERYNVNYGNLFTSRDANPISSLLTFIMPTEKPRILMFGPGLETKTSKIVRSILTDRCMNESARFKVTGLVPGEFSGVGSGISIRFEERSFNLVVLYSNVKSIRQQLSAENRVQQNKLFTMQKQDGANENDADENAYVKQYYELTHVMQELCKSSQAFIYVVDASQTDKQVAFAQAELFAMTCELWSKPAAPLLVLACRRNCLAKEALSSMAVVRALRLGRMKRKWMSQSAEVETLDGVRSGIRWLLSEI